ncbi:PIN domain-containing protein [Streptomyces sp. JNUCC 63]
MAGSSRKPRASTERGQRPRPFAWRRRTRSGERLRLLPYGFELLPTPDDVWDRVLDVQREALAGGFHRSLSMADLLIAATAERHRATVPHDDGGFERIATITGQRARRVVPPGAAAHCPATAGVGRPFRGHGRRYLQLKFPAHHTNGSRSMGPGRRSTGPRPGTGPSCASCGARDRRT